MSMMILSMTWSPWLDPIFIHWFSNYVTCPDSLKEKCYLKRNCCLVRIKCKFFTVLCNLRWTQCQNINMRVPQLMPHSWRFEFSLIYGFNHYGHLMGLHRSLLDLLVNLKESLIWLTMVIDWLWRTLTGKKMNPTALKANGFVI